MNLSQCLSPALSPLLLPPVHTRKPALHSWVPQSLQASVRLPGMAPAKFPLSPGHSVALAIPESCLTPSQPLFLPTCLPLASLLDFLLPLWPSCPSALGPAHHLDAANPQVLGPGHLLLTNPMFSLVGSFPHVASVTTTMLTTPQPLSLAQIFPCSLRSS